MAWVGASWAFVIVMAARTGWASLTAFVLWWRWWRRAAAPWSTTLMPLTTVLRFPATVWHSSEGTTPARAPVAFERLKAFSAVRRRAVRRTASGEVIVSWVLHACDEVPEGVGLIHVTNVVAVRHFD